MTLAIAIATVYAITLLITKGEIFSRPRDKFRAIMSRKVWSYRWLVDPYDFISCRMCVGVWVALVVCLVSKENFFLIYAVSYFLATQERN